jgi:uncharacterized membrane protein YvbJ
LSELFGIVVKCPHCGKETRQAKFCSHCGKPLRSTPQEQKPGALNRVLDYLAECGRDRKKLQNLMLAIVLVPTLLYVAYVIIVALLAMAW